MLKESLVRVKDENGEVAEMELGKAHDLHRASVQNGGTSKVNLLVYNPLKKSFNYQTPATFKTAKDRNTVIGLALDMGEGVTYSVIINSNCKIFGMSNGFPTCISTLGLPFLRTGKLSIAYVDKNQRIKFCPIKNVFDPIEEAKKKQPKKRGRKKKTEIEAEVKEIPEFNSMIVSSRDGSMLVCDGVILA